MSSSSRRVVITGGGIGRDAARRFVREGDMASKGGVHALTESWGAERARHGIRVDTLAPAIIRTPLIGDGVDGLAGWHPLGRVGEVADTSEAERHLARSAFVSSTLLAVDGGYSSGR